MITRPRNSPGSRSHSILPPVEAWAGSVILPNEALYGERAVTIEIPGTIQASEGGVARVAFWGDNPHLRAVVFVTESTPKGTEHSPQEYNGPLLVLSGEEYSRITFDALYERICAVLRGNRAPVAGEILKPDGSTTVFRHRPKL